MKLYGLQKMTLLDYPGHMACTVFVGGCNFRCPFCHNFELVGAFGSGLMESEELFPFLETRKGLLEGVVVSGGEPCLYAELPEFLQQIHEMGFAVKLDTNGSNPVLLDSLLEKGLVDYVAMDIKNSPAKYAMTCGMAELDLAPLRQSIALLKAGKAEYEFRTTVVAELHREEDFQEIGAMLQGACRYVLQCFTDRETVPFRNFHAPSRGELERYRDIAREFVPNTVLRGI